jgi:uncharacterized protein (TIGR00251 family)
MEVRIRVRLTPRAARDDIAGWQDDTLRVRVAAPPVDGKANDALVRLLAGALGVPKSRIGIVSGATSRDKTVAIDGLSHDDVRRLLP